MAASILFLLGHLLRTIRWRTTLPNEYSFTKLLTTLAASYVLDIVTPLRSGDFYRILANKGSKSATYVLFSSLLFERLMDLVVIPFLAIIGFNLSIITLGTDWKIFILLGFLSATSIILLFSTLGQKFLLALPLPRAIDRVWLNFANANLQVSRRLRSGYRRYFPLTIVMWIFYGLAIHYLALYLGLTFSKTTETLYSSSWRAPFWLIKNLTNLNKGLGYLLLVAVPLLAIFVLGKFSKLEIYERLRLKEREFSKSMPMPSLLFSDSELRKYMTTILHKKESLLEIATIKFARKYDYLGDLGGGSGASTYLVQQAPGDLSVLKMSNDPKIMRNLEIQYHHMKLLHENNAPVLEVGQLYKYEPDLVAYQMEYRTELIDLPKAIPILGHKETAASLQNLLIGLRDTLYTSPKAPPFEYTKGFDYYYHGKLDAIFKELEPFFLSLSVNGKVFVNENSYDAITRKRFNAWLSNFGQIGNACFAVHGDLTFQNLLVKESDRSIVAIDSNGNQLVNHPSVDLGKILQSLLLRYELIDASAIQVESRENRISYKLPESFEYKKLLVTTSDWLFTNELASQWENLESLSKGQYGLHLLRLLPYKLKISPNLFPLYYGELVRLMNFENVFEDPDLD